MPSIFISYRRSGSHFIAESIASALGDYYGKDNIFFDIESIEAGENFEEAITDAIKQSDMMLVMLDPAWASVLDSEGSPRIQNPKDYVHIEVKTGLELANQKKMIVIPVLIDSDTMLSGIPETLATLQTLNARFIKTDPNLLRITRKALVDNILEILPPNDECNKESLSTNDGQIKDSDTHSQNNVFKYMGYASGVILFLLTILTFIFEIILSPPQQENVRIILGITTAIPTTSPIVETRLADIQQIEGNSTIERNALPISLNNIVSDTQELIVAPSQFGTAMWGYSTADSRLFALDIVTGLALSITDNDYLDLTTFDNALITALHYDGTWLWLGDSRNHRMIVLDPITLDSVTEHNFGDSGEPTNIVQTGNVTWMTLRDRGEIVGLTIDEESLAVDDYCSGTLDVGESPYLLTAQGNSAIWVVYGRNADTAIRKITVTGCVINEAIALEAEVTGLSIFQEQIYLSMNDVLWQIENDTLTNAMENWEEPIGEIFGSHEALWITSDQHLIAIEPSTGIIKQSITLSNPANYLFVFGTQLWTVLENGQIVRYSVPRMTVNNAVGLFSDNQTIFVVTRDNLVCPLDDSSPCNELEIDAHLLRITDTTLSNQLWAVDEANGVWAINIANNTSERIMTLPLSPSIIEIDSDGLLWLSDGLSYLSILDTETRQLTDLLQNSFMMSLPVSITHDSATTWFTYQFPDRISAITLDDMVLRETPLNVSVNGLNSLTSDSRYIYAIENGMVAVINPQSGDIITRQGITLSPIQSIVASETLYSLGSDGAIYTQALFIEH